MSSWLAEDAELLQSVLEIVDTWDDGSQPFPSLSESTDGNDADRSEDSDSLTEGAPHHDPTNTKRSSASGGKRKLQPSTLASTYHRRREEIERLSGTIAQLEEQLALLQPKHPPPQKPRNKEHEDLWQGIAVRYRQLRTSAESEQANLRRQIAEQTKVAHGLMKLIHKAQRVEDHAVIRSLCPPTTMFPGTVSVAKADQLVRVNAMYASRNAVFANPKYFSVASHFQDLHWHQDRSNRFTIEFAEAWTLPFDYRRATEALWGFTIKKHQNMPCAGEIAQATQVHVADEEINSDISTLVKSGFAQGRFDGRAVVRRFVGDDTNPSPAIVANIQCTPNGVAPGHFAGVQLEIASCIRAVPVVLGSSEAMSRVQASERFTVTFSDSVASRHHAELFTNLLVLSLRNAMGFMRDAVESVVLTC